MHSGCELLGNSDYDVTEDGGTLGVGCYLYANDFLISYAKVGCCLGSEVNVALSCDNALGKLKLCAVVGVNELASAAACCIAGLADRSCDADRTGIGKRYFNLACGTGGSEDRSLDRALRTYNEKLLGASVLTGLAEVLFVGELIALAKENVNCLAGEVNVSCRGFNDELFHFYSP